MIAGHRILRLHCLLMALVLACDPAAGSGGEVVDTSGSGVITVRNRAGVERADARMRLERIVRIGAPVGDPMQQFGRVADIAIGPDDLIYVLDAQAREVRVFDLSGAHVRTIGRQGAGPGEFQAPFAMAFDAQGNLWVADDRARLINVFTPEGEFQSSRRNSHRRGPNYDLRIGSDGSIYVFGPSTLTNLFVVRLAGEEELAATDATFLPAFEWSVFPGRTVGGEQFAEPIPFAPRQVAAIGPDGAVWFSPGNAYRIIQVRDSADTARVIESDAEAAPLSAAERGRADSVAAKAESEGMDVDRSRIPKAHPYVTGVVISTDGLLWVRRPSRTIPAKWDGSTGDAFDIFADNGRFVATVRAPVDGFPAPHITDRHLVGVVRDSLDVQYVEVHRVVRTGG